jgi:tRNA A-37 threonylcarbamoyl transferase component Bud32
MNVKEPSRFQHVIGTSLGGCEILDLLGQGSMGEVFRARQPSLGRTVAVKILAPELSRRDDLIRRFRREARAVARLNHQNIATVYDFGSSEGLHFIVMEHVDGRSLEDIAEEEGMLDSELALNYISQAAAGLDHARKAGILHRDIKPGNLLVSKDGIVKIVDFGLAKTENESGGASLTSIGSMIGTPNYMSPEQCTGGRISPATDVYGLGGTFYRLLTGQTCFHAENAIAVMLKHKSEDPLPPFLLRPDLPAGYSEVVMKMLAKRPEDRYADSGELLADLENLKAGRVPKASSLCYWSPPANPGFQDDRHVVRGLLQWKLAAPDQIREAIRIQHQFQDVGRDERIHDIMFAKDWVAAEGIKDLWDAIRRTRRQRMDQAFLAAAKDKGIVPEERIEWVQRRLSEREKSGHPVSACHILSSREYVFPDEVKDILLDHLEKERLREEIAFRESVLRLGLLDPGRLDAVRSEKGLTPSRKDYRRLDQLVVENGLLPASNVKVVFRARLLEEIGGTPEELRNLVAGLRAEEPRPAGLGQEGAAAASPASGKPDDDKRRTILPDFDKLKMETGVFCPFCRKEIPSASVFCPYCRHRLPFEKKGPRPASVLRDIMMTPPPRPMSLQALPGHAPFPQGVGPRSPGKPEPAVPDLWVARFPGGEMTRPLSLEMTAKLISSKKITRETPVQPPYAEGQWIEAGKVKELARFFGVCHACNKPILANETSCPHCDAAF